MNDRLDPELFKQTYDAVAKQARQEYADPGISGDFYNKTWKKFDTKYNLDVLTSERSTYPLRREITFDAFCAWLIEPSDPDFVRRAISASVAFHMSSFEQETNDLPPELRFFTDMTLRITKLGPDFFNEIYFPIGGLGAIYSSIPHMSMRENSLARRGEIEKILFMLSILHYGSSKFKDTALHNPASKAIAVKSVEEIRSKTKVIKGVSRRAAGPSWNIYEPAMILLYAADNVIVRHGAGRKPANLLDAILSGYGRNYNETDTLNELKRKAVYFKDYLIKNSHKDFAARIRKVSLPNCPTELIIPSLPVGVDLSKIEEQFRKKLKKYQNCHRSSGSTRVIYNTISNPCPTPPDLEKLLSYISLYSKPKTRMCPAA